MKKKIFTLLTLMLCMCSGAWAADFTYALSDFTRTGDSYPYTYTNNLGSSGIAYKNKSVWVEVPSASAMGTITFHGNSNNEDRKLYIYKKNGTVKDTSRGIKMSGTPEYINYYASDILTNDGKYYLVFGTSDDFKAKNDLIYTVAAELTTNSTVTFNVGTGGTCATTSLTETNPGYGVTLPAVTPNAGNVFNGWYTAASDGTKVGDAGDDYHPTGNVTVYAQYSVSIAPSITTQPSNTESAGGNKASFTVVTSGSPTPTYQWYTCDADGSNASAIDGATLATYAFAAPEYNGGGGNTYYYKVTASNSAGNITSEVVSLTVNNKVACSAFLTSTSGTATTYNCSFAFYGDEGKLSTIPAGTASGDYFNSKMNDNKNYYELTLTGGFKAGDKLTVYLFASGSTIAYLVGKSAKTSVSKSVSSGSVYGLEHTLTASEIEADGTVRIYRNSSNTYFAGVAVVGSNTLTINAEYQYATFVTTRAIDMANANSEGVKAYIVTGKGDTFVTTEEVTTIPANTAILLKASDETGYTVAVDAIVSASLDYTNKLKYSTTPVDGDDTTIYGFFKVGEAYGFAPVATGTQLPAYKAYLEISGGELLSKFLSIDLDGATAINTVSLMTSKTGIKKYVSNGKLVIENNGVKYNAIGQIVK